VRIDCQYDRLVDDVLALTTDFICKILNSRFDLSKVCELLLNLVELGPRLTLFGSVVQSELQWTPCANTVSSWQAVQTNDGFQDRRFTSGLSTEHGNSRQLDVLLQTHISQFINDVNELSELLIHKISGIVGHMELLACC